MSSWNSPPRFARARSVLVGLLAVLLVALYGFAHRAELGQIVDELREALPVDRRMTTTRKELTMATKSRAAASPDEKVRKRDTGEQGNKGEFSAVSRGEADIRIPAPGTGASPILGEDAQVAATAELGDGVQIGGFGRIGEDVTISEGVSIGEGVVIRDGARIGAGTRIEDDASIGEGASVGEGTTIRQGAILQAGSAVGDGVELDEEVSVGEVAQLGRDVHVERFTRIGVRVTVDEGAVIGECSVLEDRSSIRHSVRLGDAVTIGKSTEIHAGSSVGNRSRVGALSRLEGTFGDELEVGARSRLLGGSTWGDNVEIGDGVKAGTDGRSRFADDTQLGDKTTLSGAVVAGELSTGEGVAIKGGSGTSELNGTIVIGAGSVLDGAIKLQDGTEIGESVEIHGPSGTFADEGATELDRDCEVLDRATIRSGARLGEHTIVGSAAEVGHAVTTGAGTDIFDKVRVGDFSVINGSMIGEGATVGHGAQTGYGAELGERSVIEDNVVIEPHARIEADGYIPRGAVVTETPH
ncbi:DapH/DapD/GlmU-related protein [Brachybacterium sacelli]|uniref:UDP-3-O-[3-hydroxymyristoyl] glucosamine N-acyltransferase n=1 Tax=Brachybacterium sacelli TaxID=173364 RepID=A0ABS4X2X1_9MICO|nr:DapH/DapD/GlmU-related protein [Brachybacterium sacelli]MBP2382810.1 UDP-3-O-[3-hydroxymyristoyl] glucosamine N-acyltransferase [Brachybacterium sacelli]